MIPKYLLYHSKKEFFKLLHKVTHTIKKKIGPAWQILILAFVSISIKYSLSSIELRCSNSFSFLDQGGTAVSQTPSCTPSRTPLFSRMLTQFQPSNKFKLLVYTCLIDSCCILPKILHGNKKSSLSCHLSCHPNSLQPFLLDFQHQNITESQK